jgi:adenine deaminase
VGRYRGEQEIDATGRWIVPGFIDAHLHIESSMVTPWALCGLVAPRGTTTLFADPLELANVRGAQALEYLL